VHVSLLVGQLFIALIASSRIALSNFRQTTEPIDLESFWNPNLFIFNTLGEPDEVVWGSMSFDGQGRAMIYEKRMIKGCFLENLELKEFPFDTQVRC